MALPNPLDAFGISLNGASIANAVGWLVFGLVLIGGVLGVFYYYWTKKQFNKIVTVFEIVGDHFEPVVRDTAKKVKLGKGGFEVLYLKKLKVYRVAYGGRIGKNTYYFFIEKDGYWYNGMLSANVKEIDSKGGFIPIVTTNPTMRAQYTALEKQIEALHGEKQGIWDKYGNWIMSAGFLMIVGIFAWLIFREMSPLMGQFSQLTDKMSVLVDRVNVLLVNTDAGRGLNSTLVRVG